ncbi:MAG: hypothetical protein AAF206_00480 [Bacteroidota bacterium]
MIRQSYFLSLFLGLIACESNPLRLPNEQLQLLEVEFTAGKKDSVFFEYNNKRQLTAMLRNTSVAQQIGRRFAYDKNDLLSRQVVTSVVESGSVWYLYEVEYTYSHDSEGHITGEWQTYQTMTTHSFQNNVVVREEKKVYDPAELRTEIGYDENGNISTYHQLFGPDESSQTNFDFNSDGELQGIEYLRSAPNNPQQLVLTAVHEKLAFDDRRSPLHELSQQLGMPLQFWTIAQGIDISHSVPRNNLTEWTYRYPSNPLVNITQRFTHEYNSVNLPEYTSVDNDGLQGVIAFYYHYDE